MKLKVKKRKNGFTLIELLVVIGILVVLAGSAVVALGSKDDEAAQGVSASSLASTANTLLTLYSAGGAGPNKLDSLVAGTHATGTPTNPPGESGAALILTLHPDLVSKLLPIPAAIDANILNALANAGITELRYMDVKGNNNNASSPLDVVGIDGSAASVGPLSEISIPGRLFDTPIPGENIGRGWEATLSATAPLVFWNAGPSGANNIAVGALPDDVLVAMGIGNNCDLVTGNNQNVNLAQAPAYGGLGAIYPRIIALFKIGTNTGSGDNPSGASEVNALNQAELVAVVDAKGLSYEQALAAASGQ